MRVTRQYSTHQLLYLCAMRLCARLHNVNVAFFGDESQSRCHIHPNNTIWLTVTFDYSRTTPIYGSHKCWFLCVSFSCFFAGSVEFVVVTQKPTRFTRETIVKTINKKKGSLLYGISSFVLYFAAKFGKCLY